MLFISRNKNIRYFNSSYQGIYFGHEFCENNIPSKEEFYTVLKFCKDNGIPFTYVTPLVSDSGIEILEEFLDILYKYLPSSEVVFNDWGVFYLFSKKYPDFEFIMGRLLMKQMKDMRLKKILPKREESLRVFLKSSSISFIEMQEFIWESGVRRIELDNLLQGIIIPSKSRIKFSLYFPYNFISITRLCPTAGCREKNREELSVVKFCNNECRYLSFILRNSSFSYPIILRGNTYFVKNDSLRIDGGNIDRLIVQPEIPF